MIKIEWVAENTFYETKPLWVNSLRDTPTVPVIRLALVDAIIEQAVMFARWIVQITDCESDEHQDAKAFLASPGVAEWRKREEGQK